MGGHSKVVVTFHLCTENIGTSHILKYLQRPSCCFCSATRSSFNDQLMPDLRLEVVFIGAQQLCYGIAPSLDVRLWNEAQRAEVVKKVHKPLLEINVINFELSRFNAYIHFENKFTKLL